MPSYSLGEMMSLSTARVGRRSDIPTSTVSQHVNMALMEVASVVPHSLSEKTAHLSFVSGSASTSLPTDFGEPIFFSLYSSGQTLAGASASEIESRGTATGLPTEFAFFGTNIEVRPVPSSDVTVVARYRQMQPDLIETSDVPSLSTPWRHAALLRTEVLLFEYLGNHTSAAMAQQRYLSYVGQLDTDEARRRKGQWSQGVRVHF